MIHFRPYLELASPAYVCYNEGIMKVKINIRLEEDLINRLKELERTSLIRVAVHVHLALRQYLDKKEGEKNGLNI
jgi:hypothetical protein